MATQICPNCKEDSFTWAIFDEEEQITIWFCSKSQYEATEDEAKETICLNCNTKTQLELKDVNNLFTWCSNCNLTKKIL